MTEDDAATKDEAVQGVARSVLIQHDKSELFR